MKPNPTAETATPASTFLFPRKFALPLCLSLFLGAAACSGPCESLSDTICDCEPNDRQRNNCLEQVRAMDQRVVTPEEKLVCEALLETCTCEALDREDFAACGLIRTPTQ